ncbi:cytosine permease [bacterium]|nr:cytosine permease [bacterium]MBP9807127.1 cytosine permease [bacterium]
MATSIHDDFSRTPVSSGNLRPWWYLLVIEIGVMISIPIFVFGGQLGLGLSFQDLVLSTFSGAAILGVIGALTARLGAVLRCTTALIARITFGSKGASCIAFVLTMGMTAWWGVQTEMFANAVLHLAQQVFHVSLNREVLILVGGVAMITTAALGIRAIGRLSYLAVPLLTGGLVYALSSLAEPGQLADLLQYRPAANATLGFGAAAAMVTGGFVVGASMNPDYSRFARTTKHALAYSIIDYALVYPALLVACGSIAIHFRSNDIMIHLVPTGLTWLIFVMMMFATWAANDCNLYSSSLSLAAILPKWQRSHLAIAAGIVGIVLAELHVVDHMVSFLTLLGILIAPISGIFVINACRRKEPMQEVELEQVPNWRIAPLLAWLCGAAVGFIATPREALGLGLVQLTTVPTLDSIIAASIVMVLFLTIGKSKKSAGVAICLVSLLGMLSASDFVCPAALAQAKSQAPVQAKAQVQASKQAQPQALRAVPTFWPPVVGRTYPEIELCDLTGKKVKLSSYAGRVILLEPIGMSCPACQAFVGGEKKGGINGVTPQGGTSSLESYLAAAGVSPTDTRVVHVQLLLYGPNLGVPTLAEAQAWAKHFDFGRRSNEVLLVGDQRYINQHSYDMIPGMQLIDKNFVLVCDATGHNPRSSLFGELIPSVSKLLR